MSKLVTDVAYAKSPEHNERLSHYEGGVKGRYLLAFLAGVGCLGGSELRAEVESDLGSPEYRLDTWYPVAHMVLIFDRAARAGIELRRLGGLVLPAYKRAHPERFEGQSVEQAFDVLERGFREDTTYGGVSQAHEITPGLVRLFRTDSPVPCDFFCGVVEGLFHVFGVAGTVSEVECQWEGAESCCFEAHWEPPREIPGTLA